MIHPLLIKTGRADAAKAELDKGQAEYERGLKQFNAKAKLAYGRGGMSQE